MKFLSSQLGMNIHLAGMRHFGLDEKKTIEQLFSLPYQHVRIPIPFDEIAPKKGVWSFEKRDWLIDEALKHDKIIHLQFGAKTIGWPEVWLPKWLGDTNAYIHQPYACIDKRKEVQEFLLDALEQSAQRYMKLSNIGSIQIENEAFCKRLSVANFRYISYAFHQKELAVVRKYNKANIPILQNLPLNHLLDMLQSLPYVFKHSDIIGLNIYNQHIPSRLHQTLNNLGLQSVLPLIAFLANHMHKKIYITELQTAPWLSGGKPITKFSPKIFEQTLQKCLKNGAEIVFLWDVEQILGLGNTDYQDLLKSLSS